MKSQNTASNPEGERLQTNKNSSLPNTAPPQITLPKGGGSIKSIDEKFSVNAVNGTSATSITLPFSPSRNEFTPSLPLSYSSGNGNSPFGLGWTADVPAIVRTTGKKLPQYQDATESDVFSLAGGEDLTTFLLEDSDGKWTKDTFKTNGQTVTRYRPRIEGSFNRIEKIDEEDGNSYWRTTSSANVVSIFGKSKTAQLHDPADPSKIFKWMLEFCHDDKGNCYQYEYKAEDLKNVEKAINEQNRLNGKALLANLYLKRIKYGNSKHFSSSSIELNNWTNFLGSIKYLLEMVFDYGEHSLENPQPNDDNVWQCRTDPYSDYRAGFEIRTFRLCKRALMFHHFKELGELPCLVSSILFEYDSDQAFSFLTAATRKGHIRKTDGTYTEKAMPPVEYSYQQLGWDTTVKTLPKKSLDNLSMGLNPTHHQWIDLYSEGLSGILSEQEGGWFFKRNNGEGNFDPFKKIATKPSLNGISTGHLHFQDLEANGEIALVSTTLNGYYEIDSKEEWLPFKNFSEIPNYNPQDPNLKQLDLTGDGKADILIADENTFTWHASKGKKGFHHPQTVFKTADEEKGPAIRFNDGTQTIVLADMSGDGLLDIVRIRNGEIVYWPNLGYGKFGAKVAMGNAPVFDTPENFDPAHIKLADLDGSGNTGLVYLGKDSFNIYFNRAGNSWSQQNKVNGTNPIPFPKIDQYSNISVIDLLGNGTACITWSSPLPSNAAMPLCYIDLMDGKKPHVLIGSKNNMGAETSISYRSSTFYYLQDKKAGKPWITKLPFPVQCVSETVSIDHLAKTRFTSQYSYHHGYYDPIEKEFRGFGRVEQTDTESFADFQKQVNAQNGTQLTEELFHQPPILTKTWFHTGAFLDLDKILDQFAQEYFRNSSFPEKAPEDMALMDLGTDEWREAPRACKGMMLRTEVYSPDGSELEHIPYSTSNSCYQLEMLQPSQQNSYAVWMARKSETLTYSYERNPEDPRIAHTMAIETDVYGNVLKAAAISYGRKQIDVELTVEEQAEQHKLHLVCSANKVTNSINSDIAYHLPMPCETMSWELTGATPASGDYFSIAEIKILLDGATEIPFEAVPSPTKIEKRLVECSRSFFLRNDLSGPLTLGIIESLALPYQSYKMALTPGLCAGIFGDKVNEALLLQEGRYVHLDDSNYWIASGTVQMDRSNFYQVITMTDPFGSSSQMVYDDAYHLFLQQITDALGNTNSVAAFNFRTLQPYLTMDINDNLKGLRSDELGMATTGFTMGKAGENKGDRMDLESAEASSNDRPGTTIDHDLFQYKNSGKPNFTKTTIYETHFHDRTADDQSATQVSYSYISGDGGTLMQKKQAEPGLALQENANGTITTVDTTPNLRWIGNGRTVMNNKGKPIKQYEPYFSTSFEFEDHRELVERGISPTIYYDSVGRAIRTDFPDGTYSQVRFDSWKHSSFDANDTVLSSQWYADRIIQPQANLATAEEISAANKAAAHANTPTVNYLDSLGRNFITLADNGALGKYKTLTEADVEGNLLKVTDARGNVNIRNRYDMLGENVIR